MMLHGLALASLITQCAPGVAPSTMAAIVQVESGGNPFAIDDNTTRRSYYPRDRASAEALANQLTSAGHLVDMGIAQIDSMNFARLGVNVHTIFDSCTNLRAGAEILSSDYDFAKRRYGNGQIALRHAIGMYNTGRLDGGARYVKEVLAAADIHEQYNAVPRVVAENEAMRSSLLVRVPVARHGSPHAAHKVISPSRAPILVTIARTAQLTIF
jgi:type IV secretion system protein VirB1